MQLLRSALPDIVRLAVSWRILKYVYQYHAMYVVWNSEVSKPAHMDNFGWDFLHISTTFFVFAPCCGGIPVCEQPNLYL